MKTEEREKPARTDSTAEFIKLDPETNEVRCNFTVPGGWLTASIVVAELRSYVDKRLIDQGLITNADLAHRDCCCGFPD